MIGDTTGLSLGLQSRSIHFSTPAQVADTQGLGMSWTSRSIPELRLVCKTNASCWGGLRAPEPPVYAPLCVLEMLLGQNWPQQQGKCEHVVLPSST